MIEVRICGFCWRWVIFLCYFSYFDHFTLWPIRRNVITRKNRFRFWRRFFTFWGIWMIGFWRVSYIMIIPAFGFIKFGRTLLIFFGIIVSFQKGFSIMFWISMNILYWCVWEIISCKSWPWWAFSHINVFSFWMLKILFNLF